MAVSIAVLGGAEGALQTGVQDGETGRKRASRRGDEE